MSKPIISGLIIILLSLVLFQSIILFRSFKRNLAAARASGLRYIVLPIYVLSVPWQISKNLFIPFLKQLPTTWTDAWLPWLDLGHLWYNGHKPFEQLGSDIFIAVSPQRNVLWTCNPEANNLITSRRSEFPKPTEVYGPLNTFGPTLPGIEGEEWRKLRKITGRSFHEDTNRHVWIYTRDRVKMLLQDWTENTIISHLHPDLAQLMFHIISRVCFNKAISWPSDKSSTEVVPPNHELSYGSSLNTVFQHLHICFLTPPWLLQILPFRVFKAAKLALREWRAYIDEMYQETMESTTTKPDLLTTLVQASSDNSISPKALGANIFIFHAAGYETTGNTLAFALLMLACFPSVQEKLHIELDDLFGSETSTRNSNSSEGTTSSGEWRYERCFPALIDGYTGAILSETLRLFNVLSWLPKSTSSAQHLTLDNQTYLIPRDTLVIIATDATHRNLNYWTSYQEDGHKNTINEARSGVDLRTFSPERWLQDGNSKTRFHPRPGSYLPFSSGSRSCIGQRFAEVEMCATLASLLYEHKIELVVENCKEWTEARNSVLDMMEKHIYFEMVLKMPVEIPLKLVKRTQL